MSAVTDLPALSDLALLPYIDAEGQLPGQFAKAVGVYAIFDQRQQLQFVGYSRDVSMSLKQHLVRCPQSCHGVKVKTIDKPQRTVLEAIQAAWIVENGDRPPGNGTDADLWTQAINVTAHMTDQERETCAAAASELEQAKTLKQIARRVESDIMTELEARGLTESLRFDPKLKEKGLLNIKPAK